jgi:hypothetical protein
LIEMGARWYDSSLGRWISADTIVPDMANPQSLNRYSYVYNNPVIYVDPTGHSPWYTIDGQPVSYWLDGPTSDPETPDETVQGPKEYGCGTLAECMGAPTSNRSGAVLYPSRVEFEENELIEQGEFEDFLEALYQDIKVEDTPRIHNPMFREGQEWMVYIHVEYIASFFAGRGNYDTPFWNAGGPDTTVCVEGHRCARQSDVNYVAQGMWSAQAGESLLDAYAITLVWKKVQYREDYGEYPWHEDILYWTAVGWTWYNERDTGGD